MNALDTLIQNAVDGRPCSEVSHNALWMLVDEWLFHYFRWETFEQKKAMWYMLTDDIADVLVGNPSQFGDKFQEKEHQALSYTRPDGSAFYDSDYDDV